MLDFNTFKGVACLSYSGANLNFLHLDGLFFRMGGVMDIHVEQQGKISKLQIRGDMTIYSALELKERLVEILKTCREMIIDLSQVEEIDCAGVQILVLIKREVLKTGKILRLVQHSPAALETMEALNLFAYFGDPSVVSAKSV